MSEEYVTEEIANCAVSDRAEKAILGAVLINNAAWPQAAVLRPSEFSLSANRTIFTRMHDLRTAQTLIDEITLAHELEKHKELEAVGGVAYLAALIDGVPERSDIMWHVGIVKRAAGKHRIARAAEAIMNQALDPLVGMSALREQVIDLEFTLAEYESNSSGTIREYGDIPDIMEIDVPPVEWLVEGVLPRKSLVLWTGIDGTAKTYLAMHMALMASMAATQNEGQTIEMSFSGGAGTCLGKLLS